jgi:hypothetical protein
VQYNQRRAKKEVISEALSRERLLFWDFVMNAFRMLLRHTIGRICRSGPGVVFLFCAFSMPYDDPDSASVNQEGAVLCVLV